MPSKFEDLGDSGLERAFLDRQGEDGGKMIGEILNDELAKDAEKFPRAKQIMDDLQKKLDAMPASTPETLDEIKKEAADMAARNAPTPSRDFLDNGLKA